MTEFLQNITEDWQDDLIAILGAALPPAFSWGKTAGGIMSV